MEMSWWALLPTIVVALIIAGAALIRSGDKVPGDSAKAAKPGGPLPTFGGAVRSLGTSIRDARKPVWPIDYAEFNTRVRRGLKAAAVIALVITTQAGTTQPNTTAMDVLLWFGMGVTAAILIAFGSIASVIHSAVLQLLPWRGPLATVALATLIGFAAGIVLHTNAGDPNPTLIVCGVMYGIAMAFFDLFLPSQNAQQPSARRKA